MENSVSEVSTAKELRKALDFVGPIDQVYVNSFKPFSRSMEEPIRELLALGEFIASVLRDGDAITASGDGGESVDMEDAPVAPIWSAYFTSTHFSTLKQSR